MQHRVRGRDRIVRSAQHQPAVDALGQAARGEHRARAMLDGQERAVEVDGTLDTMVSCFDGGATLSSPRAAAVEQGPDGARRFAPILKALRGKGGALDTFDDYKGPLAAFVAKVGSKAEITDVHIMDNGNAVTPKYGMNLSDMIERHLVDCPRCRAEVAEAESMMRRSGIRWLSTTTKSIEEIATTILQEIRPERLVY